MMWVLSAHDVGAVLHMVWVRLRMMWVRYYT